MEFEKLNAEKLKQMNEYFNGNPYLECRSLLPFEQLMLKELGGLQVLQKYLGKQLDIASLQKVF